MKQFKKHDGSIVGETSAMAAYFRKPDESMQVFSEQLKKLSAEDKTELAMGAAKEMGWMEVVGV